MEERDLLVVREPRSSCWIWLLQLGVMGQTSNLLVGTWQWVGR